MKRRFVYFFTLFSVFLTIPLWAFGQFSNFNLFDGGIHDGQALLKEYISPWANAFGADLNAGWFNTARPHKTGGVDVTLTVNMTVVPSSAKSFDLSDIQFDKLSVSGSEMIAPTVAGSKNEGPTLEYVEDFNGTSVPIASFSSPAGTGFSFIPSPMLQVGIGLPAGTEIIGRYLMPLPIPNTDAKVGLWGVGLKHSIRQWIPGIKHLPFGLSVFGGYTRLNTYAGFHLEPLSYDNLTQYRQADFNGQEVSVTVQAYTVDLLVSTALPVINVFGGIGYSKTQTDIDVRGNIPIPGFDPDLSISGPVFRDQDIYQIPSMKIRNQSGLRVNAGFRLKLAVLTIHGDYTWANYSVYTAGVGIRFR